MKKKMLALMLMLLAALSALTAAAEGSLPDVGEIISGFKVTQLYALDALGGVPLEQPIVPDTSLERD